MEITQIQNMTTGRLGPRSGSWNKTSLWAVVIIIAILVASTVAVGPAFATDELRLIGIVKSIDPKTGIVFVDIQTESCPGIRRFYADDMRAMSKYVNKTITFYIDSAVCNDSAIHTIRVSWGIKQ